ncbi:MAG: GEVED domain-containing protein [Haliscomenobacter sp.]|uniref:GEVED domain-containing protein n=1 Tax=Haliscomenobacter sp. TaxID=2717303 RepID=UPI0029A54292|nr:GEVED domain-containing protein [Haliscomenobacter sp.]MDX2071462.1 GEVED domain-containing protein [Haliscomenobacter sp.]
MKRALRFSSFIEVPLSTCFFQNKKMACLKLLLVTLPVLFCGSLAFAQSSTPLWAATPSDHITNMTRPFDFAGMVNAPNAGLESSDGSEEILAAEIGRVSVNPASHTAFTGRNSRVTSPGTGFLLEAPAPKLAPAAASMVGQLMGLKIAPATYCQGESFSLSYQFDGGDGILPGNTYTIQLSNNNFSDHLTIGRLVSSNLTGSIQVTIPFDAAIGGGYEFRVVASTGAATSTEYGSYTIAGARNLQPVIDVNACLTQNATFTTATTALSPTYLWKKVCTIPGAVFTNSKSGLDAMGTYAANLYYANSKLYVATSKGLGVSSNNGASFALHLSGQINDVFANGNGIYLATPNGVRVNNTMALDGTGTFSTAIGNPITAVYARGSDVYAAGSDGIYFSNDDGVSFPDIPGHPVGTTKYTTAQGLGSNSVNDLFIDGNGTVYAATTMGISILYPGQTNFVTTNLVTHPMSGLLSNNINSVYVDAKGVIYLGTNDGVSVSTDGGTTFTTITDGLGNSAVGDIFVDEANSIIYAATTGGLSMMHLGANKFTNFTARQGLGADFITSLAVNNGTVFAGNGNGVSKGNIPAAIIDASGTNNAASYSIMGLDYLDANCRFFAEVTVPGCTTPAYTNIASLNDIPPQISVISPTTSTTKCDNQDGSFTLTGLYPNVSYQLQYLGGAGIPASGATVTADASGQIVVSFLAPGTYTEVHVRSTVGQNCESNKLTVVINPPAEPAPPVPDMLSVTPVCGGSNVTVGMPAQVAPLQYRWYTKLPAGSADLADPGTSTDDYVITAPSSSGSVWVRIRNTNTNCLSDSVKVDYTVNPGVTIDHAKTEPTTANPNSGTITITGPAGTYNLSYVDPVSGPQTSNNITFPHTISGLGVGNYTNFVATNPATGCVSNTIASCRLLGPPSDDVISTKNLQTVVCGIPGVTGGYLQKVTDPSRVSSTSITAAMPETVGAIAAGRIRQTQGTNPTPADLNEKVEMRGWVQFNLSSIPINATITKVEFTPTSVQGGFQAVNDVEINTSATGDIQFDITQMTDDNYGPYANFNDRAFNDLFDVKYNDFVIGSNATGAKVDLGPSAVADAQRRLASTNQLFQLGLTLSGTDFDVPVFQFHGKVFDLSANQQLCITYVLKDYGDLPEPKFATDLAGGLVGPSHVINLIDLNSDPNITSNPLQPAMYIGATPPDAEVNGQPNATATGDGSDEDINDSWFTNPATNNTLVAGSTITLTVPVTNNLPEYVNVVVFVDWNNNGVFENTPAERYTKKVDPNPNLPNVGNQVLVPFDLAIPNVPKADSIGVRIRLTSGAVFDAYGPAPDGEVEDFIIELRGTDYGDLPDATTATGNNDYQTLKANNGARHGVPVTPLIYMGTAIDTESDGQPNLSSVGDDNNLPIDDEDGIIFLGPLVPGRNAQLAFKGVNKVGIDAKLHIWADWNNDGTLEYVSGTTFASSASPISQIITFAVPNGATFDGGKVFFRFRFTTDVTFNTAIPNPSPNGLVYDGEVEDYFLPIFKMGNLVWEDRNHNGLQDNDEINLGIQNVRVVLRFGGIDPITGAYDEVTQNTATNPNTPNIDNGVDAVRDFVLQTFTDTKGTYCFIGLIEGRYQIISVDTFGLTPTRFDHIKNVTEEDLDSDGKPLKNPWAYVSGDRRQSKSQIVTLKVDQIGTDEEGILDQGNPQLLDPNAIGVFPDDRVEQRIDFGYVGLDLGDLAESTNIPFPANPLTPPDPSNTSFITTENGTTPEGPKHIVTPDLRLGNCQDVEWLGQPDQDAGAEFKPGPDSGGDDPIANFSNYPNFSYDPSQGRRWPFHDVAKVCGDDEDGIRFLTPMVPGYDAILSVKYFAKTNLDGPDAYLHAWFDWNGDGNFDNGAGGIDPNEHIIFYKRDGVVVSNMLEPITQAVKLEMSYLTTPGDSLTLTFKVPADVKYNNGNILSRFRISFDPYLGPNGILAPSLNFPDLQPGAGNTQVPGGIIPYGEVEDYFIALSKVGNTVFEDRDHDGFQDVLEPGIKNVPIKLQFAGADGILNSGDPYEFTYHDTTDANGRYYFCGLIGNVDPSGIPNPVYQLIVEDPAGMTATFNNTDPSDDICIDDNSNGDDLLIDFVQAPFGHRITTDTFTITNPMMLCLDENAPRNDVGGLVTGNNRPNPTVADALNNFPDNQYDETRDFGYTGFDYGDLPINSVLKGSKYLTLRDSVNGPGDPLDFKYGPRHAIQPRLYLGDGVDGELNGKPDADAGSKAGGDDDDPGAFKKGKTADDENGIRLLSPLIPGEVAYIKVKYTSQDTTNVPADDQLDGVLDGYKNVPAYLDAFMDWNGNGEIELPGEKIFWTHQGISTANFDKYEVKDTVDTYTAKLIPISNSGLDSVILAFRVPTSATFDTGTVFMRFRLGWTNYSAPFGSGGFPAAFPIGLGPDNNIFHMTQSPYVKSFENNLPTGAIQAPPNNWTNAADNTGRYPYPQGEVEDYAIPVAQIGNLAWYDHNVNGHQDDPLLALYNQYKDEYGVDTLQLVLIWGGVENKNGTFDAVGYQDHTVSSAGTTTDILYNLSLAPPAVGSNTPGLVVKTNPQGLYSFRGLIPGRYYLIPKKYLDLVADGHAIDSAQFVNQGPKHRILTLKNNTITTDSTDSDAMPGAAFTIADGNPRDPEVSVGNLPVNENGQKDVQDVPNLMTGSPSVFPDNQWDKTIDFGWIDEPVMESNLDIVGVNFPTSQICGNFNVIMHVCIKNTAETPLDSLMIDLNLANAYGDAYVGTPKLSIVDKAYTTNSGDVLVQKSMVGAKAALTPYLNDGIYDGSSPGKISIFKDNVDDSPFYLPGDSVVCVQVEFEINPTKTNTFNANVPKGWHSQAQTWARAVGFRRNANGTNGPKTPIIDYWPRSPRFLKYVQITDLTDEVDDPMPMANIPYPDAGDGVEFYGSVVNRGTDNVYFPVPTAPVPLASYMSDPRRDKYHQSQKDVLNRTENDPAIQNDECWINTKWNSGYKEFEIALDAKCEAVVNADLLVPNFIDACGFDKYPMGSYYRVIIQDKWTEETLWASVDRVPFDVKKYRDRQLIYKVRSVANHCNIIWGPINFVDKIPPVVTCPPNTSRKLNAKNEIVGTYTFVCSDVDSIYNVAKSWNKPDYAYYTGLATATDACGDPRLENVKDEIEYFADCNASAAQGYLYAQIRRTFSFIDLMGNKENCTQLIYIYRPVIKLPLCKIEVPNDKAKGDNLILPADLAGKKYDIAGSVPYFINGSGKKVFITGKDYCGFAFNYTDEVSFSTGQGLCGKKIIRTWSIFDWCYGTGSAYPNYLMQPETQNECYAESSWNSGRYTWQQTIIVGDSERPIITALDVDRDGKVGAYTGAPQANPKTATATYDPDDVLEYSTGPMDCTGGFVFDRSSFKVTEQSDWCYEIRVVERVAILDLDERPTGVFVLKTDPGVKVTGDCAKGYTVSGVPILGDWFVEVRVYDACYQDSVVWIPVRIVDKISPVMKCDDKLNITLDNQGNGFVAAKNLDEGSWDNCKMKWVKVRRPVAEACVTTMLKFPRVVDANKNGKLDPYDPSKGKLDLNGNGKADDYDYIDLNSNGVAEIEEYFTIGEYFTKNPPAAGNGSGMIMTPLMDTVPFFCCDGSALMVELWGMDKFGNLNYCWNNIQVDDKTPIQCLAPWEATIYCDDKSLEFIDDKVKSAKVFGDVIINSGAVCIQADTTYSTVKRLKCGAGTIERIWVLTKQTAHGPISTTCKQIIRVLPVREYNICFPKDVDQRDCKVPVIDTAVVSELGCDILAVNVSDKRYDASDDECYKIFRTYTVINWCAYDDNCGDPMTEGSVFVVDRALFDNFGKERLYVLVRDADRDLDEEFYLSKNLTTNEPLSNDRKSGDYHVFGDADWNGDTDGSGYKSTDYSSFAGREVRMPDCDQAFNGNPYGLPVGEYYHSFMYTQIIKVYDEVKPVVTADAAKFCIREGADCLADIKMVVTGKDNCTNEVTLETQFLMIAPLQTRDAGSMILYGTPRWSTKALGNGQFEIIVSNLPQGKHDLIVVVRDECGNLSEPTRIPFTVEDCKAPAPICINGLSTELMPDGAGAGMMTVWASDFVASKIYDCNGQGPETNTTGQKLVTKYSINRVGSPVVEAQTSLALNCNDAGKTILVELHAWDNAGNHDFCVTYIEVQDNRKVCGGSGNVDLGSISGLITTDEAEPLQGAQVDLSGAATMQYNTPGAGTFAFNSLTKGSDFSVSAQLDKDHINGVTTFDLVLIQKHILGVKPLEGAYRMIAADVNNSKSISTLDMIQIRKLILQIDTKFNNVPSWKFVDAAYKFPDAQNPFTAEYPEIVNVNDLAGNVRADFIAVKMGDVNGSAATISGVAAAEVRSNQALMLKTDDIAMKANTPYEIAIRAKDLQNIQGYQFTLNYDLNAVELEGITYGVAKAENFGIFKDKGAITTSWNLSSTLNAAGNEVLFTLKLRAKTAVKLSEVLNISSRLTPAEAYDKQNEAIGVKLSFGADVTQDFAVLRQNTPNPFQDETLIGFYLPKATKGTLTIRDTKGSLVYRQEGNYVKGENRVILKQADLRASGVLYYTFETADFTDTKKMILLNR